jgi:hypothetical protein
MADQIDPALELINALEAQIKKVHTQSLDISFNELIDMKRSQELNITPDFQRLFRWTEGAQSRFIESLLLEMPVPPIYVVEEDNGKYTLIDGLQRISSYLHLRGELTAPDLEPPVQLGEKLKFVDCDIVEELNGKTWDDLGTALQIKLKRSFVRVEVVRKGSASHFKYHMFKRLNTGGELLTPQQIRNCTIRLLNTKFIDFIIELSKEDNFKLCSEILSPEQRRSSYDQELVLRFFALKNNREGFIHSVEDFLTEYMESVSDPITPIPFDYEQEEKNFKKTFGALAKSVGDKAFGYANKNKNDIVRGFGIYQFEAFTMGVQGKLGELDINNAAQMTALAGKITEIKLNQEFITMTTGGGKNSKGPLKSRISFVEEHLNL